MILYDYFRSSAAWRVRIALAYKGIDVERRYVHLLRGGGEQRLGAYLAKNPQGLVPALELDDGTALTQSLAIIDYLEALQSEPRLIPADPVKAAMARGVALAIACDIHPLTNLRVGAYLDAELGRSAQEIEKWRRHWFETGLEAVEQLISPAPYCCGSAPTIADLCLVPQLFTARRFGARLGHLPKVLGVEAACLGLPAFSATHPSLQPDAE